MAVGGGLPLWLTAQGAFAHFWGNTEVKGMDQGRGGGLRRQVRAPHLEIWPLSALERAHVSTLGWLRVGGRLT